MPTDDHEHWPLRVVEQRTAASRTTPDGFTIYPEHVLQEVRSLIRAKQDSQDRLNLNARELLAQALHTLDSINARDHLLAQVASLPPES